MSVKIVGLCGLAGSGKTSIARHVGLMKPGAFIYPFSCPLKAMLDTLGVPLNYLHNHDLKEVLLPDFGNKSARYLMQTLGTEWGRNLIDPDIWVKAWERNLPKADFILVDDVRFQNEVDAIERLDGLVIKLRRVENPTRLCEHASEQVDTLKGCTSLINTTIDETTQLVLNMIDVFWGGEV